MKKTLLLSALSLALLGSAAKQKTAYEIVRLADYLTMAGKQMSGLGQPEENFKSELQCKLKRRSPENFNYRIFITK